ncbi:hypothetical protein BG011_007110 [Mortierella polycephala]|uniref:LysM domain-containing protein n=1 Tax=Mortierella polycephala TaxID=41804 RepID=A0A9P6PUE5_9FUNG|nr:hypothetical protein BG011_007110 [Mortierella polycephala]
MKFTLSVAALALAATQVMAVVPTPAANCTVSIMVTDSDVDGCAAFAARHDTTFEMLLKMNDKLRKDCLNLDVGHPICVSWDVKATQPVSPPTTTAAPVTTAPATTTAPAPGSATTTAVGTGAPGATTAPGTTTAAATTTTGSVIAPSASPESTNGAAGSTASMMLAAAGVMLSVAYMM